MLKKLLLACAAAAIVSNFAASHSNAQDASAINDAPFVQLPGQLSNPARGDSYTLPGTFRIGRFFTPGFFIPASNALTAANRLYAAPYWVGSPAILKSVSFNITTGIAGAWNGRMCVYADSGNGSPGNLIANGDSGTVAISAGTVTGTQTVALNSGNGIPVSGWIWVGFMADTSGQNLASISNSTYYTNFLFGNASANASLGNNSSSGVFVAQTFGACPTPFGAATFNSNAATPAISMGF